MQIKGYHAESHQGTSCNRNRFYFRGGLALSVIGLQTFIKTGESSLNKLVPLRSTLNMGTLSFPSKFVRSLTLHLPTGVCLFSLLPATGRYYLLHFLPSTISDSTARGRVKSLLTIQKKSLPLKSERFTSRSVAAMLCFLHLICNGEEHVLQPEAHTSFCWLTYPHWFSYKNSCVSLIKF